MFSLSLGASAWQIDSLFLALFIPVPHDNQLVHLVAPMGETI